MGRGSKISATYQTGNQADISIGDAGKGITRLPAPQFRAVRDVRSMECPNRQESPRRTRLWPSQARTALQS